ncbi:HDOD domain-containing protein [Thiocystis violacea]|uniref:HDOD domain-containing protein n=1 Tax=Thiocystis violacea TaxID=13725 RepID=UPI001905F9AE|nr:HDOD domain-containing protein [Thiocystis violacea]MBK1717765.1 histidine kinase [Thiocystis violacea]
MQQTSDALSLLAEIELTRDLAEDTRATLSGICRFEEIPPKRRVKAVDVRTDRSFLVDGHVVLLANGSGERLQAFQGLSEPIDLFGEAPAPDACLVTETPCLLMKIPAAKLGEALSASLEVSDIDLDSTEGEFLAELYHLITNNRLVLPARPEVALKIQEITNDPDAGLDALTEIIQRDGTIAGALLHATNSPLFRASKEIKTIRDAVVRLGFRNTRMLAVNLALRQAFLAKHEVTRTAMEAAWAESVLCSAFGYIISDIRKCLNRERALLAGLVSGIGAVPIIQFVEMREPNPQLPLVQSLVDKLSGITGVLVINYWGLGDDLVSVAEHFGDWGYQAPAPDYTSIAMLARWAALQSEGRETPNAAEVPAFKTLGLMPPPPGEPIAELAESGEVLESLKSMFNL